MGYCSILLMVASARFFMKAAEMQGRSTTLYCMLSLGMWFTFTGFLVSGLLGGIVSQALLFLSLTVFDGARSK